MSLARNRWGRQTETSGHFIARRERPKKIHVVPRAGYEMGSGRPGRLPGDVGGALGEAAAHLEHLEVNLGALVVGG